MIIRTGTFVECYELKEKMYPALSLALYLSLSLLVFRGSMKEKFAEYNEFKGKLYYLCSYLGKLVERNQAKEKYRDSEVKLAECNE